MRQTLNLSAGLFGLIIILLAGLNVYVHTDLRDDAIRRETTTLERQARIQAQEIENSLSSIHHAIDGAALRYRIAFGDPAAMHRYLRSLENQLPYVRAIGITDARGDVRHSSRSLPAPGISLADRESVAYYLNGGTEDVLLSGPALNRIDNRWQFSMSAAIRDEAGVLIGVVSAVIDPQAYAENFHRTMAAEDYVALLGRDFTLIAARAPWHAEAIGTSLASADAYKAFAAGSAPEMSGIFPHLLTGETRIVAIRRFFDDRLIVSTSRPLETALQGWRAQATIISVISLAVLLIGIGIGVIAYRFLAMREREAEKLAQLNSDLQEQTARAERAAAVKSDFLATMSHEIRTPMNGVLGMAQAMDRLPLDRQARDYLGIIRDSSESLLGVINDILDFSRLEAGKLKIEAVGVRIAPLLESLEALFAPAAEQKKLAFRIEAAPGAPAAIETDHMRLRQILMNLIGNAVKFTAAGHVLVWVRPARLADGRAGIRFEVEDTGIGVAPEALPHLFERFSQEDASISRRFGGTGLGLAICKRLCDLLGGQIGCRSEKNAGSLFWIELPVAAGDDDEIAAPAEPPPVARGGQLRILAVDDNPVNRRIIQALLQPFGHDLDFAGSGREALGLIEQRIFDVVLLDIHMPEMDGFETLRRLRRLPYGRHLRVLALTADVVPEATVRYDTAGFDDVVAKPVMLEALLAALAPRRWAAPIA